MSQRTRILVVDDELPVCRSLASALEGEAYDVATALSAEEALEKDAETPFDLVVADLMMPGLSGMDLLREVRRRRPAALVVMITGYPSVRTAVQAVHLGAFDYLPKPFSPAELRSVVERALRRRAPAAAGGAAGAPPGLRGIPGNAWVRGEDDGSARVGAHHPWVESLSGIATLELPAPGETRVQGEACLRLQDGAGRIYRLWTPVTGRVLEVNARLREDPGLLLRDPYGEGWVLRLAPAHLESDLANLAPLDEA